MRTPQSEKLRIEKVRASYAQQVGEGAAFAKRWREEQPYRDILDAPQSGRPEITAFGPINRGTCAAFRVQRGSKSERFVFISDDMRRALIGQPLLPREG